MGVAIQALSGEVQTARRTRQLIDQQWPCDLQTGTRAHFYRLARVVTAVETLDFAQARSEIARPPLRTRRRGHAAVVGTHTGLAYLGQDQPDLAYQQKAKVTDDRTTAPVMSNDRNVLDGWRALALHYTGRSRQAETLVAIDTIARTITAGEIPLGVLTALIGASWFFVVLRRNRERIWSGGCHCRCPTPSRAERRKTRLLVSPSRLAVPGR